MWACGRVGVCVCARACVCVRVSAFADGAAEVLAAFRKRGGKGGGRSRLLKF